MRKSVMPYPANDRWSTRLAWIVFALAGLNTFAYVLLVSDPLISSDSWYFLDVFVRHALDGTLQFSDFFVKRSGLDHVEPLRKLILLMELRWFDLDFVPGAVIGLFCAGGCSLLLASIMRRQENNEIPARVRMMAWAVVTVLLFSLNSTSVWTWPLVASAYSSVILVFAFFAVAWHTIRTRRVFWLALLGLAMTLVADDTAEIALCGLLMILLVLWLRGIHRQGVVRAAVTAVGAVVVAQIFMHWMEPVIGHTSVAGKLSALWHVFVRDGWWKWWALPLANSVITGHQLKIFAGDGMMPWQIAVGFLLVMAHCWFWWRFLRTECNGTTFFSAVLMVFFYAIVAGIIVGRVSSRTSDYLYQPRYVLFYQFNLIALAMMYAGTRVKVVYRRQKVAGIVASVAAAALLLLQLPLSMQSWHEAPYVRAYYAKMARQIVAMTDDPTVAPAHCMPELPPCRYSVEKRSDLTALLKKNHLNVYSAKFRQMHGMLWLSDKHDKH